MKTIILIILVVSLSGCAQWPKDSLIRDGQLTTPWGTATIGAAATGTAAQNLSEAERRDLLTPKKP